MGGAARAARGVRLGRVRAGYVRELHARADVAILPTPFPREVFELALRVSPSFAALCDAVSRDDEFLRTTLSGVIKTDEFTRRIWDIYERCGAQDGGTAWNSACSDRTTCSTSRPDCRCRSRSTPCPRRSWRCPPASARCTGTRISSPGSSPTTPLARARWIRPRPRRRSRRRRLRAFAGQRSTAIKSCRGHARRGMARDGRGRRRDSLRGAAPRGNVFDQRLIAQRLWEAHGVRCIRATLKGGDDRRWIR